VYYNGVALGVKGFNQYVRMVYHGLVIPGIMKDLQLSVPAARKLINRHFPSVKVTRERASSAGTGAASGSASTPQQNDLASPSQDGAVSLPLSRTSTMSLSQASIDDTLEESQMESPASPLAWEMESPASPLDSQMEWPASPLASQAQQEPIKVKVETTGGITGRTAADDDPDAPDYVSEDVEQRFVDRVKEETKFAYVRVNDRWEVGFAVSPGGPGFPNWPPPTYRQTSFVNGIATTQGGSHVRHVQNQIEKAVMDEIRAKHKGTKIQPVVVRSHCCIFVNVRRVRSEAIK
jgi:hypothetical protein